MGVVRQQSQDRKRKEARPRVAKEVGFGEPR